MDDTSKMFELSRGDDRRGVTCHVGRLVDNEDDVTFVAGDNCACLDDGEIAHGVVVDAA